MIETEGARNINEWLDNGGCLINPTSKILKKVSRELAVDDDVTVRVVLNDVDFRRVDRELTTGGRLVDLADSGVVSFFSLEREIQTNLFVSSDVTGVFTNLGSESFAVGTNDDELLSNGNEVADALCENGDELDFRTPSLTSVEDTLVKWFDESFYETFYEVVDAMEETIYEHDDVFENKFSTRWHIYASLILTAAFENKTLKQVSQCAEQAELTSRSTMSMVKRTIEDEGFIETEKTEAELGRPPVMLKPSGLYTGNKPPDLATKVYDEIKIRPEKDRTVESDNPNEGSESDSKDDDDEESEHVEHNKSNSKEESEEELEQKDD